MRIGFDIILIVLIFTTPWWVVFIVGIIGAIFFQWYLELIFAGVVIDIMFGGGSMSWYRHMMHTIIFMIPVGIMEIVRPKINYYGFSHF